MHNRSRRHESSSFLQVFNDLWVSVFEILAGVVLHGGEELTIIIHWHDDITRRDKALGDAYSVIFFTKSWSAMYDTCTCILCDELAFDDNEAAVVCLLLEVVEQRNVLLANKILTFELLKDLVLLDVGLLQDILQSRLSQNVNLVFVFIFNFQVYEVRVDGAG